MKFTEELKDIAERLFKLSAELLHCIDNDDQEHAALIESVKKTPAGKYFSSRA